MSAPADKSSDKSAAPSTRNSAASEPARSKARRQWLGEATRLGCGAGLLALGLGFHARQVEAHAPQMVRPPGARPEREFLSACIRCGLCVRDCPYHILELARPGQPVANGTPYFVARQLPCEMCEDIPCVKACPTGALDPSVTDITKARMGLAVLIDHESCLNYQGLRCDICHRVCPLIGKAISLDEQVNTRTGAHAKFIPVVHSEACTGCGKCEKACPLEVAAIKVHPLALAKGESSSHYRMGWVEKDKAGGSLVAPDPEHRYNLPEGMRYESGRVLRQDGEPAAPAAPQAPKAVRGDKL